MAKRGALEHDKTLELASSLGIMDCFALGILEALWHYVGKYRKDGEMTGLKPSVVARSIRYTADPDQLWDALIECRLLDTLPDGRVLVHGWSEHADDAVHTCLYRAVKLFADGTIPKPRSIGRQERARLEPLWDELLDGADVRRTDFGRPPHVLPVPEPVPEPEPNMHAWVEPYFELVMGLHACDRCARHTPRGDLLKSFTRTLLKFDESLRGERGWPGWPELIDHLVNLLQSDSKFGVNSVFCITPAQVLQDRLSAALSAATGQRRNAPGSIDFDRIAAEVQAALSEKSA